MKRVFINGKWTTVELGQRVVVATCGSGHSYFGEFGTITKFLNKHIVITTDSGTIVKVNDWFDTVGKASKNNYWASVIIENREDMIPSRVHYWNDKKCCMEYK